VAVSPAEGCGLKWTGVAAARIVLGRLARSAYADHLVVSISLIYLYILPVGIAAIFCEGESAIASSWFVSCFMTITPAEYQPGASRLPQSLRHVVLRCC